MFGIRTQGEFFRKFKFRKLRAVFSLYINCIDKKLVKRVIPKVPMIACLYVNFVTCTCLEFFATSVRLETGAYFKIVWSILITSEAEVEYFSTMLTIS